MSSNAILEGRGPSSPTRWPDHLAFAVLALLVASCGDPRPAAVTGEGASGLDACVYCHGSFGRSGYLPGTDPLLRSAPPVAPSGKPAAVVGAHLIHLNPPVSGALRAPIACNECHVVPNDTTHATNPPANPVAFGTIATARGAAPTYQPVTLGCSAVYCHGNFAFDGVTGANATPLWTGASLTCVSCHGMPPTGHPALTGTVTAATCSQCHPTTVNPDGSINVNGGGHVNGLADVSFDCTSCHGTAGRIGILPGTDPLLASAPPVAPVGAPPSAVGAHQPHLNPAAAGAIHGPVPCAECHVVPTTLAHATNPPAVKVVFGALATTQGAVPIWTPNTTGCSATYCHGNFAFNGVTGASAAPLWTGAAVSCASCHGMPPTGHPALTGTVTAATCSQCHPGTVNSNGTIDVAGGRHMNGLADVSGNPHTDALWADPTHHGYSANQQGLQNCTGCHLNFGSPAGTTGGSCNQCHSGGTTAWQTDCTFCHGAVGRTGNVPGTDARLAIAPPVGPQGQTLTTDAMVGAHQRHVNPPVVGRMAAPFACVVCHATTLPASVAHVNGQPVPVPFGGIALTGNVAPTFNPTTLSCSATYCHGNFAGGATTAAPTWTGAATTCTSCHATPPATGQHDRSEHRSAGCGACHSGYAATTANVALHVNGVKDVGGAGTSINSWNPTTKSCGPGCHGTQTW